jgi:DNA-binding IclR family transcriptional regulator
LRAKQSKTSKQFLAELAEARELEVAISHEELARGITCVAAPVFTNGRAEAVAAVSACFVSSAGTPEDPYAADVLRVAAETSRVLGSTLAWTG